MVVNKIKAASYQCQQTSSHTEKVFISSFTFPFLTLSSSLHPEEIAATLWPWGDKHGVKNPHPLRKTKQKEWALVSDSLAEPLCWPRGLPSSKLLVMKQIYHLQQNTSLTNTWSRASDIYLLIFSTLGKMFVLLRAWVSLWVLYQSDVFTATP